MSKPINVTDTPSLPNVGYYNKSNNAIDNDPTNPYFYSYNTLTNNLSKSCSINNTNFQGIYDDPNENNVKQYIPAGTQSLDIPFYLAKTGVLKDTLQKKVDLSCVNNRDRLVNQIQYLTCQLENVRNREYNSDDFKVSSHSLSIKSIFQKFSNLKIFLMIIFMITIYLLISGFFSSLDFATNVFSIIESNSTFSYSYWIGLLIGLALPMIILCIVYTKIVCKNLSDIEKYQLYNESVASDNNPYGNKKTIPSDAKNFDLLTLILFILLIYAFVAVLFTIKKNALSKPMYIFLVSIIFVVISIFIFFMYSYIPFFTSADPNNIRNKSESKPLELFIDNQTDISNITTNQTEDNKVRRAFLITAIIVFIFAIIFFSMKSSFSFFNGLFGSSAILILPILWVFNFVLAIQYFYVYPMIIIIFRFIRYIIMSIIYVVSQKNSSSKDGFSDDLINIINNFKNYSPSWGLIGIDELKLFLNIFGYSNDFSKAIISENNNSKNISDNKFVSSGALGFIFQMIANKENSNMNGIIYSVVSMVLTILISIIILYGVAKIQK